MKSAYRQIALAPEDVQFSITAIYNPHTDSVDLHEMYGQPCGAGRAVPNFCRVERYDVFSCLFYLHVEHFFDDFWVVEPELTIVSARLCMQEFFQTSGIRS